MSDIPALAPDRILRFHAPDKVFHSLNAITWFALLFTGMYVYFLNPSDEAAEIGHAYSLDSRRSVHVQPARLHRDCPGPLCSDHACLLGVGSQYDLLVPQLRWLSPPFLQDPVRSS